MVLFLVLLGLAVQERCCLRFGAGGGSLSVDSKVFAFREACRLRWRNVLILLIPVC